MTILIASFPETKSVAIKVATALKAKHTNIISKKFPDNESHIKFSVNPKGKTVVIINSLSHNPNERIIETYLAASIAKDYQAKKIILMATYFPYMRQDTHFENYDSSSAKHISKLFSIFDKVYTIDPHLHRISTMKKLSRSIQEITTNKLIANYIKIHFKQEFTIVGPDKESQQWANRISKTLNTKAVILKKIRLSSTKVKIKSRPLGKNVIIIDDIISTGNTIIETIKIAKAQGARRVTVIGIHGILLKDAAQKIKKHAELITTNTILNRYARIDVSSLISIELKRYK